MAKRSFKFHHSFLILVLTLACASATAQTPIPSPLLVLQDADGDSASLPLLLVQGGGASSTQGIKVTGQFNMPDGGAITTFQPTGFGGITLLQTSKATSGAVQGSPIFSICGQQLTGTGSGNSTPACWNLQVTGTGGLNMQDILLLSRTTANSTNNITLQVPDALNIAPVNFTGTTPHSGQLTIASYPSADTDISGKYVTVVGGFTTSGDSLAKANPLQLFPGWLQSPNSASSALEGALQIGTMVKAGTGSTNYQLACYSSAQTAQPCGSLTNPLTAPLLGVYSPLGCPPTGSCSTGGSAAIVAPPSRAFVAQSGTTSTTWTAGTPVCRDTSSTLNGSYAAASTTGSCPIGQAVGVAVGDATSTLTMHLVDLDFAPQGTTSSGSGTTYATAAASLATAPSGNLLASDGSGNVGSSGVSDGFTATPYVPQVVAVYNATGRTGSITSTPIASGAQGQYSVAVYINLTAACTTPGSGSLTPSVTYTDTNGTFTKSSAAIPMGAIGTLPANNNATVGLWSVSSPGTISVAVAYVACTAGPPTYDVHFVLTKLQ